MNSKLEAYKAEARERWGNTPAYKEYDEKTKGYGEDKWSGLAADMDGIFSRFALCVKKGEAPNGDEAQKLVEKLQSHISENYSNCTKEILFGLGQMYVADERFKNSIDKHAEGTAAFVSEAITCFSK